MISSSVRAEWVDITPNAGQDRPITQRLFMTDDAGGVPAVRIGPNPHLRQFVRPALWTGGILLGVPLLMTLAGTGPYAWLMYIPLNAGALALLVLVNWLRNGSTTIRVLPMHIEVEWRAGWLHWTRALARAELHTLQPHPEFPYLLQVSEGTTRRFLLVATLPVVRESAEWLARQLKSTVVYEQSRRKGARSDESLGEDWEELEPDEFSWGHPQRVWMRGSGADAELAIQTKKREITDFQWILIFLAPTVMVPLLFAGLEWLLRGNPGHAGYQLLYTLIFTAVLAPILFLARWLWRQIRGPRTLMDLVAITRVQRSGIAFGDGRKENLTVTPYDETSRLMVGDIPDGVGFWLYPLNRTAIILLETEGQASPILEPLHPATARIVAEKLSKMTDLPLILE